MTGINVDYINPFLMAATGIIKDICQIEMKIGKPYVKETAFADDSVIIMIGITGEMRGQVMIVLSYTKALEIASKMMMGMPVEKLDEMSISAISELGNMIMGNAATIFSTKGILIDITPPTVCRGNLTIAQSFAQNICVPLSGGDITIELDVVLHEPEMPANTGNIGRTCVAAGARLHLIEPLGFSINDKMVKRAGLDYWDKLDVTVYDDFNDFCERNPGAKIYMATTKAHKTYTEVSYEPDCYIMFGKESAGIPEEILVDHEDTCVRIPMIGDIRSLNLSNSVAIVLYEALRQNNFDHMNQEGHLHRLEWHDK